MDYNDIIFIFYVIGGKTYHLILSDYRYPWTTATPEASRVHCQPLEDEERHWGVGLRHSQSLSETQRKHCFRPIFYKVSLGRAGSFNTKRGSPTVIRIRLTRPDGTKKSCERLMTNSTF